MSEYSNLSNKQLVMKVSRDIAEDPTAPAAARMVAVRTIGEIEQMLGKHSENGPNTEGKSLNELSIAEIDAELRRLRPPGV